VIDASRAVRVIPPGVMPGRLTGNARHLTDPAGKVYYATMEEGFYEVDIKTLTVKELFPDANRLKSHAGPLLPGYHGKGFYSGQGRVVYANNGEMSPLARTRPDIESGALAEWPGKGDWRIVLRKQFTEVTGPGGIYGNAEPDEDPLWSIGWDHRSLILMLLDRGRWHRFRLPKTSHCYDGAHGWNTEWPRIRDIGEDDLLMTMHGMFWRFPRAFRLGNTAGIGPRASYLKVIADFCRWNDRVVFGCDDAAKREFLNTRRAKAKLAGPAQSQSNLWFVEPERIDRLGPALGRGAVWIDEPVRAGTASDAFLIGGFEKRGVHLAHDRGKPVTFRLEVDRAGDGSWTRLSEVTVGDGGYGWSEFPGGLTAMWIRVAADADCRATAWFECRNRDARDTSSASLFRGLARADEPTGLGGLLRAGDRETGLQILATRLEDGASRETGYYELKPDLSLVRVDSGKKKAWMAGNVAIPTGILRPEGSSILYVDDDGKRFRLPVGNPAYAGRPQLMDLQRTSREACTERDLFQCAGTFFELPARNAGGFAKIRPVATHRLFVQDYCSWRGLLVLSGVATGAGDENPHIVRSGDGRCAVWLGALDDLWQLGKAAGRGGPWNGESVEAGEVSDPFLMAGYDRKSLALSHESGNAVTFGVEIDITGTGHWKPYRSFEVAPGETLRHEFPAAFSAYWVRLRSSAAAIVTGEFRYE
jgi:hypothetical protein